MTRIKKILGRAEIGHISHCVAKLENDHYAVGQLAVGQMVEAGAEFETLNAAFDNWVVTLPAFPKHEPAWLESGRAKCVQA
ncbi:MAG: hypothetical protein A2Z94_01125 [Gallionellales bacterium GWA2_55_18]|nr:MAG: hypothetical protein A2Z94_01125 [Gallionellales bacterium GWA2_55_18]